MNNPHRIVFPLAGLLLASACWNSTEATTVASPSPLEVGPPELPLSEWLELSEWPASEGAYQRVYGCDLVDVDAMIDASTTRRQSVCAYRLGEHICTADWEGTDTLWSECCSGVEGAEAFCTEVTRQFPQMEKVVELHGYYREYPKALADRYYYHGTARRVDNDKLPEDLRAPIRELHKAMALMEIDLMVNRHAQLDGNVPICVGQGNNWGFFCFKRADVKLGALVHYDTHADFAFRRDGYPFLDGEDNRDKDHAYWALQTGAYVDIDEFIQPSLVDGSLHPRTVWVVPAWTREFYPEHTYHVGLHVADGGKLLSYSADMNYDGVTYGPGEEDEFVEACEEGQCRSPVQVHMSVVDAARQATRPEAPLFLSIDLDFFGSTNPSPEDGELPTRCPTDAERREIFERFDADLAAMEKPAIVPIALSPDFSCRLWESQLLGHVLASLEKRWGTISPPMTVADAEPEEAAEDPDHASNESEGAPEAEADQQEAP